MTNRYWTISPLLLAKKQENTSQGGREVSNLTILILMELRGKHVLRDITFMNKQFTFISLRTDFSDPHEFISESLGKSPQWGQAT